jgi:hypothetical protein
MLVISLLMWFDLLNGRQNLVTAINIAPQGFKGPNYGKLQTNLLKKDRKLLKSILSHICGSWSISVVSLS